MKTAQGPGSRPAGCTVSVIIKVLNEQANIAAAIESALAAVTGLDGEVILADSGSTDRTLAIASDYPIRIVQLLDEREHWKKPENVDKVFYLAWAANYVRMFKVALQYFQRGELTLFKIRQYGNLTKLISQ